MVARRMVTRSCVLTGAMPRSVMVVAARARVKPQRSSRLSAFRICRAVLAVHPPTVSACSGWPGTVVRSIGAHASAHGAPRYNRPHQGRVRTGPRKCAERPMIRARQPDPASVPSCQGVFEWTLRAVMPRRSGGGGHDPERASRWCCTRPRPAAVPVPGAAAGRWTVGWRRAVAGLAGEFDAELVRAIRVGLAEVSGFGHGAHGGHRG